MQKLRDLISLFLGVGSLIRYSLETFKTFIRKRNRNKFKEAEIEARTGEVDRLRDHMSDDLD